MKNHLTTKTIEKKLTTKTIDKKIQSPIDPINYRVITKPMDQLLRPSLEKENMIVHILS
jgi:hypothetical protein